MDDGGFRARVLGERTRALASRRTAPADDESASQASSPVRLVCASGSLHYALPIESVAGVLPFVCHATPFIGRRAARAMLGLAVIGGQVVSVLDLAGLLPLSASPETDRPENTVLLAMRTNASSARPAIALGVERVLGALRLHPADEPGHAVLPDGDARVAVLVRLVDETMVQRAIASIETVHPFPSDPAGA